MIRRPRLTATVARAAAERAARRLAEDDRILLVYFFGSAVDDARRDARDIDIAILAQPRLPLDDLVRLRADAVDAAGGAPIDLVSLNDASIVLAHEVADTGRCLYARTPDDEAEFVTRARSRYWDFKPFLDAQWRLAGERLEERRRRGTPS